MKFLLLSAMLLLVLSCASTSEKSDEKSSFNRAPSFIDYMDSSLRDP